MDKSTIQTLIDKVIGKKGLIRVPSWWMRKVLMQIADWVQEGDDANDGKIVKVKEEADGKISTLETNTNSKISTLETNTNSKISTLETNTNSKISTLETDTNNVLFELVETAKLPMSIKCFAVKTESGSGFVIVDGVKKSIPANTKKIISFVNDFRFARDNSYYAPQNDIFYIGFHSTDTSTITDMNWFFHKCPNLTSLDLSSFDTSAVTSMNGMFYGCSSLTSLDLSSFDTSAVTSMNSVFYGCSSLTSLILGPNFFKVKSSSVKSIEFSYLTKWANDTVVTSLVTNSYDRVTAGLSTMTLKLSNQTKAALTDEQKAAITAKGYTIA